MNQPSVFISCVSPEFRQTRSRVAAILALFVDRKIFLGNKPRTDSSPTNFGVFSELEKIREEESLRRVRKELVQDEQEAQRLKRKAEGCVATL
jgi:hypothetical protein